MALLAAAAMLLTACSGRGGAPQGGSSASLPEPPVAPENQILGDDSASLAREITLYRASEAAMELTAVIRLISPGADGNLTRAALEELFGARAAIEDVEFSSGAATVRLPLDAAAGRSDSDCLLLCCSIANTLLGIDGVEAVNVLSGDRAIDICGLPLGTFTGLNGNIPALYAQLQSERERFAAGGAVLERSACLYFPAYGGQYLLPEVRTVSFPDEDYASALIEALCAGPQTRRCCFSFAPEGIDLLEDAPHTSVTSGGERVLELALSPVLANYLALSGIESWQFYGSLVLTLTSFLPELDAVRVSIGGQAVTECDMGVRLARFPNGEMRRTDFDSCAGSSAWLYFARDDGNLVRLECAVSRAAATSAGSILPAMITLGGSYLPDLRSAFPEGIGPEDLLGVSVAEGVATVNLSGNFYCQCQSLDAHGERSLIYAMVNALTELDGIGAVGFLVEGRQVESLAGSIYLRTPLLPDPGLVRGYAPDA